MRLKGSKKKKEKTIKDKNNTRENKSKEEERRRKGEKRKKNTKSDNSIARFNVRHTKRIITMVDVNVIRFDLNLTK